MKSLQKKITRYYIPPLVLIIIILTVFSSYMIRILNNAIDEFQQISVESTTIILNGDRDYYQALTALSQMVQSDPGSQKFREGKNLFEENSKQAYKRVNDATNLTLELVEKGHDYDKEVEKILMKELGNFNDKFIEWDKVVREFIKDYEETQIRKSIPGEDLFSEARNSVDIIGEEIYALSIHKIAEKRRFVSNANMLQIAFSVTVLILSGVVAWLLSKIIAKPIKNITEQVEIIGNGDYTTPVSDLANAEITEYFLLTRSLEKMRVTLKESFYKIANQNDILEKTVELRTEELVETNQELESSMEDLKVAQNRIIESKKYESINKLLMEIAHRMNTPLGNTILLLSYLKKQSNKLLENLKSGTISKQQALDCVSNISKELEISLRNTEISASIINDLKITTDDINTMNLEEIDIESSLRNMIKGVQNELDGNVEIELRCEDSIILMTYQKILFYVLTDIIKYSYSFIRNSENALKCKLKIFTHKGQVLIEYHDNCSVNYMEHHKDIFEPFYFTRFDNTKDGTELSQAYRLVTQILNGDLKCKKDFEGDIFFEINLPQFINDSDA